MFDSRPTTNKVPGRPLAAAGFTLVEFLIVVVAIAVLTGFLMPAISRTGSKVRKNKAAGEVRQLADAILAFRKEYNRWPVSPETLAAHARKKYSGTEFSAGTPDWVFGNYETADSKKQSPLPVVNTATGYQLLADPNPEFRETNNSEVVAVLMDIIEIFHGSGRIQDPDFTKRPINADHSLNPKKLRFLQAPIVERYQPNGVDKRGTYRDPWGRPYIVILDLDSDGRFLSPFPASVPSGSDRRHFVSQTVGVLSAGPDGRFDLASAQDAPSNHDNVYSW
jgi:prepilin-type N-terminal cleavage/methylation domain-containing protein